MAVPKRKKSRSKRNMHRSHHAVQPQNIAVCAITGEFAFSHNIAINGSYKGKSVFIKQKAE